MSVLTGLERHACHMIVFVTRLLVIEHIPLPFKQLVISRFLNIFEKKHVIYVKSNYLLTRAGCRTCGGAHPPM